MEEKKERTWQRRKGRKGFTLIELIVVMAVMAVLVLLAAPKFLGHTKEATFTKHINNAKVLEDASERYYIDHGQWPRGEEEPYTPEEVAAYADKIYDITGEERALEDGNYWDIDYDALSAYAKLPDENERANYVLRNPVGKVYYLEGLTEEGQARLPVEDAPEPEEQPQAPETHEEWAAKRQAEGYVLAADHDFTKVDGTWRFTGTATKVIVPHVIQGEPVTSYKNMFRDTSVSDAASDNPDVTDMSYMFSGSKATTLDLSSFNTANVTNMGYMFSNSAAKNLNLNSFNTANVTNMGSMFQGSKATTLDLSSFDTSNVTTMSFMFCNSAAKNLNLNSFNTANVTDMGFMFDGSKATTLDLSSFDTSNVTNMGSMFAGSKATTLDLRSFDLRNIVTGTTWDTSKNVYMFNGAAARTGIARTTADRDKLNNTYTVRPSGLTFIVK